MAVRAVPATAVSAMCTNFHEKAKFSRQSTGSADLETVLLNAVRVLALFNISHYVSGSFAVQEHGYARFTMDIDIIVPDTAFAREKLTAYGLEVNLLRGGARADSGPVALPMPQTVSDEPQILDLERLISVKLSSYIGAGIHRIQDYSDAVELMKANHLPRDYGVDARVRNLYQRTWDGLRPDDSR